MIILAIETSCDDTCAAVLEIKGKKNPRFRILSNVVSSQVEIHRKWGGVYPFLAKREHQKNLPIVLKKTLKEAGDPKIDLIAVTVGPGLEPCLWVGINFAKDLATAWKKPLVAVNHLEGHLLSFLLLRNKKSKIQNPNDKQNPKSKFQNIEFPAIALLVSGGHTQLVLMKKFGEYKTVGETRDDAAGECFDKVARILGLGYPGGPAIAAEAAKLQAASCKLQANLPRPMIYQNNYDFSFSGLKTAVLYLTKQLTADGKKLTIRQKRKIADETQQAIIDVLIHKTLKAAKEFKAKTIILGGGVVANEELRKQFSYKLQATSYKLKFLAPSKIFCTDNAAMIALSAYFHTQNQSKHGSGQAKKKEFANLRTLIIAQGNLKL